jgi:sugar lactone lactonase YvrE
LTAAITASAATPTITSAVVFASGATVGGTGPDSVAISPDGVWIAYTNGADSTGLSGSSTVVEYDFSGNILNQLSYPGYVDGLRYDEERGLIWILQNQDGNSGLILLDRNGNSTSLTYGVQSSTRGYDDVAFINGAIFMSYTNPTGPTDASIQYLTGTYPVSFSTVLEVGATGTNLATHQAGQATTQNDPDSLIATPFGGLMLTSGDDGQFIFVHDLDKFEHSVSFLQLLDPSTGKPVSGLDDGAFATTPSGTFYVSDFGNNRILQVNVKGLTPMTLFASVGSTNTVAMVDMKTGNANPFITNVSAPHGLAFVPNFNSLFGQ